MLLAAMEFEEVEFALDLLYLIQNGIVDANAPYDNPDWNKVDAKVTRQWEKENFLGFDIVNLYCVRLNVDDWEVFMARSDEEARGYVLNKYNFLPKIIKMDKAKWLTSFWLPESKEFKSLLDIKRESNVFPRTALII